MPYISADGTIGGEKRLSPFRKLVDAFLGLKPQWKAVALVGLAIALRSWLNPNPLANGNIPASALPPDQHWQRLAKDDSFVRSMTQHLSSIFSAASSNNQYLATDSIEIAMDRVDFGGPDGHVAEKGDWNDLEAIRGTRCSTTRSAVTAYFCGADVAKNQDAALGNKRKGHYYGVQPFVDFLSCRHQQGEKQHNHRRSVYRIGIACQDNMAGYSHAFSIVAQPDGSFFWLQSFIGHYSLPKWMKQVDPLSLEDLLAKLNQVQRLMNITGWSTQANADYHELFGVDKEKEAMKRSKPPVHLTWQPTHRLDAFYWDEACEYPLPPESPDSPAQPGGKGDDNEDTNNEPFDGTIGDDKYDECVLPLVESMLQELQHLAELFPKNN